MKQVERTFVAIIALYIIALPFANDAFAEFEVLAVSSILLTCCAFALSFLQVNRHVYITITDVVVLLFLIYELIHISIIAKFQIDGLFYLKGIVLGAIYLISRMIDKHYHIFLLIIVAISGGIQSLVGIFQYYGILIGGNSEFNVTGSFNNPGPFGGYLAISFVATICLFLNTKNKKWKIGYCLWGVLICSMLIYSDSRAAWIATGATIIYIIHSIRSTSIRRILGKRVSYLVFILLCTSVMASLYHYKKTSADVRLLIWTVSWHMATDALLYGHSINSFSAKYMEYQAKYLKQHPNSEYAALADNNTQSFNELVTIACEQGICGVIILISLLFLAFSSKTHATVRYLLLTLCIFSCFSYPSDILSLSICFPLLFGLASKHSALLLPIRKTISIFNCATLLIVGTISSLHMREYYQKAFEQLAKKNPQIILTHNNEYMAQYATLLLKDNKHASFISLTTSTHFPFMTSLLKCDIGRAYWELGQMEEAEEAFQCAYWMVPPKILPKYLLFILYRDMQRNDKAQEKAEEIISQEVRQIGSIYLEARAAAQSFLNGDDRKE